MSGLDFTPGLGLYDHDPIPPGPYRCVKCSRWFDECKVTDSVIHFKMSGKAKKHSGFYKAWKLECLVCGTTLRPMQGEIQQSLF